MNTVTFTEKEYRQLKKAYKKAVEEKVESFVFQHNEYLTSYAKYVLEYLSTRFEKK